MSWKQELRSLANAQFLTEEKVVRSVYNDLYDIITSDIIILHSL